ncbi:MAG: GntR family transcriptional regulator [Candidatus Didemnitutus sp.]|nr:GntR family transcriptional regulator [Candidatus Didemnitutus sp.]
MLAFPVELKPGLPITEQVLFAVKKAVVAGQLKPGEPFPSVRVLSQELRINPNTAHKIIATLVAEGVLVTTPAVGSIVAERGATDRAAKAELLGDELERVVVEAKKLGLTLDEVQGGLAAHWKKLGRK